MKFPDEWFSTKSHGLSRSINCSAPNRHWISAPSISHFRKSTVWLIKSESILQQANSTVPTLGPVLIPCSLKKLDRCAESTNRVNVKVVSWFQAPISCPVTLHGRFAHKIGSASGF